MQGWVGIGIGDDSVSTVPPESDFRQTSRQHNDLIIYNKRALLITKRTFNYQSGGKLPYLLLNMRQRVKKHRHSVSEKDRRQPC